MNTTARNHATITLTGLRLWDTNAPVTVRAHIPGTGDLTVDLSDCIVAPGLQDPHVHFRDPGTGEAETMLTGARAAAHGGYTNVLIMPNTQPAADGTPLAADSPLATRMREAGMSAPYSVLHYLQSYERITGVRLPVNYELCAAATLGREGHAPSNAEDWMPLTATPHPVVALSDDGATVPDNLIDTIARTAAAHHLILIDHCEHHDHGVMNRSTTAETLGVEGIDPETETRIVARDITVAQRTGVHLHLQHLSTAKSVALVRQAKQAGIPVTCETAPHYLALTDRDVATLGSMARMNPPLRDRQDQQALLEGIADGTIDMIATDHAPHPASAKNHGLAAAANGVIGLESAYGVCHHTLVTTGIITNQRLIELMAIAPGKLLNHPTTNPSTLTTHGMLDLTDPANQHAEISILAPNMRWTIQATHFASRARNTPFNHWQVTGKPITTIINGTLTTTLQRTPRA